MISSLIPFLVWNYESNIVKDLNVLTRYETARANWQFLFGHPLQRLNINDWFQITKRLIVLGGGPIFLLVIFVKKS